MRGIISFTLWTVRRKSSSKKTQHLGLRLTPEQKRAIETLAIELGYDVVEFIQVAVVAVYAHLGKGHTQRYGAITRNARIWDEIVKTAGQLADAENKAISEGHQENAPQPNPEP